MNIALICGDWMIKKRFIMHTIIETNIRQTTAFGIMSLTLLWLLMKSLDITADSMKEMLCYISGIIHSVWLTWLALVWNIFTCGIEDVKSIIYDLHCHPLHSYMLYTCDKVAVLSVCICTTQTLSTSLSVVVRVCVSTAEYQLLDIKVPLVKTV